jgi:hypothetical protein
VGVRRPNDIIFNANRRSLVAASIKDALVKEDSAGAFFYIGVGALNFIGELQILSDE